MKTTLKTPLVFWFLLGAQVAFGQVGWLIGNVTYQSGSMRDSVNGAFVHVDGLYPVIGSARDTITGDGGSFAFDNLTPGLYSVTARMTGLGFATEIVEVNERIPSYVLMELTGGEGVGEYEEDLTAQGQVVTVVNSQSGELDYFLDVGGDSELDYRLSFGSSWYSPPDDSLRRPNIGDVITVSGAPFTYGSPPMIIVRGLNNSIWRNDSTHGGEYGGAHYEMNCTDRPLLRIEASGSVEIQMEVNPLIDSVGFLLRGFDDSLQVLLDFGAPWYEPGGGAHRPLTFELVHVVGGFMTCPDSDAGRIIVYEINGQFWRQPGDTTGLGATRVGSADPGLTEAPTHYLTASNYPNPFNAATMIRYFLPVSGRVSITVFDISGREVGPALDQVQAAGDHTLYWSGTGYASGVYLYRICLGNDLSVVRRMILLK